MTESTEFFPAMAGVDDLGGEQSREWFLTVIFHPQCSRIGEISRVPMALESLRLGRNWPLFQPAGDGVGRAIADRYVSRCAFRMEKHPDGWCLRLEPGRSRLRIDGDDATDGTVFSSDQLQQGLTLSFAHRVVLRLRLGAVSASRPAPLLPDLLGVGAAMQQLRQDIQRAADAGTDVLLTGPTGSGKECVARAIHGLAASGDRPWVAVNMAALPAELAAASLFGARRGAYTGADRHREGFFQQAAGGTLFLDEVGDTPEPLQPMLLRALQEREVQVVGGPVERVELRIISASERPLDGEGSRFRAALRYRLGANEVFVPALLDRLEDVGLLAAHFFRREARRQGRDWLAERAQDRELARWARCFELFACYPWPGNVRELAHAVAQIGAASTAQLQLPAALRRRLEAVSRADLQTHVAVPAECGDGDPPGVREKRSALPGLGDVSDRDFLAVWRDSRFEVATAARRLGVSRPAVYRRLKRMEQCRLAADVPLGELLAALDQCRGDLRATATRLAVSRRGLETRLRASGVESLAGLDPGASG